MVTESYIGLSRVLVVEDNTLLSLTLTTFLEDLGVGKVLSVETVGDALGALSSKIFDLAIVDIQLGDENGLEVAKRCSAMEVPVIISTGFGNLALPLSYGSEHLLLKPYRQRDLENVLALFFRRKPGGLAL